MYEGAVLVGAGIDWLTLTATTEPAATHLILEGEKTHYSEEGDGNESVPWRAQGYVGTKRGETAYGRRADGAILVLSGPNAHARLDIAAYAGVRCTRADVQATYRLRNDRGGVALHEYLDALERPDSARNGAKLTLITGSDGGSTMYVGSRRSDAYARLYDKWVESGGTYPVGSWRWEVEFKGELAGNVVTCMLGAADRSRAAVDIMRNYFMERGFPAPGVPYGTILPGPIHRATTDRERKLEWLRSQCRPSVDWLRAVGAEAEVRVALGLDKAPPLRRTLRHSALFGSHHGPTADGTAL